MRGCSTLFALVSNFTSCTFTISSALVTLLHTACGVQQLDCNQAPAKPSDSLCGFQNDTVSQRSWAWTNGGVLRKIMPSVLTYSTYRNSVNESGHDRHFSEKTGVCAVKCP